MSQSFHFRFWIVKYSSLQVNEVQDYILQLRVGWASGARPNVERWNMLYYAGSACGCFNKYVAIILIGN